WAKAIAATAERRDAQQLRVAVTTPDAPGKDDPLGDWYWLDDDESVPFEQVLVPGDVGPPMTAPQPRFDLIDRGVSIQAPTLHEWARQLLADHDPLEPRNDPAALSMMLTEAHWRVLRLVGR